MVQAQPPTKTLQELIMAAHFRAPLTLSVLDLADWVDHFSDHPIVQYLPTIPQANLPQLGAPQMSLEMISPIALPRILLRSPDGRYSLQLQGDRFALGWARIEPVGVPAEYPGFEAMLERWTVVLSRFEQWTEERFQLRLKHRLVEINYANAAPLEHDGQRKRISEIFRFLHLKGRSVIGFNANWVERIYSGDQAIGTVSAAVGLGQVPPETSVVAFNFIGMAEVAENQESKHIMKEVHGKIREVYESAIVADAH